MDKLLCIFLRKKKENGNLEAFKSEFMERRWGFRDIKISKVFNVFNFFLNGGSSLLNNMNPSLENPPKQRGFGVVFTQQIARSVQRRHKQTSQHWWQSMQVLASGLTQSTTIFHRRPVSMGQWDNILDY